MIHVLGEMEQDSKRFHHTAQNDTQFKTYKLFISRIFHLIFSNHSWPQVTETVESKLTDKEGQLYTLSLLTNASYRTSFSELLTAYSLSLQKSKLSFSWIVFAGKSYFSNKILNVLGVATMSIYSYLFLSHSIWYTAGSQQAFCICWLSIKTEI